MIAFIKHAEQRRGTLRCTAVPLLLPPYLPLKGLIVSVCWFGWYIEVLTPSFSPFPPLTPLFLLLCFCADEIKDDFDTMGPDATLQAVGNGTGEFLCALFFLQSLLPSLHHALKQPVPIFWARDP